MEGQKCKYSFPAAGASYLRHGAADNSVQKVTGLKMRGIVKWIAAVKAVNGYNGSGFGRSRKPPQEHSPARFRQSGGKKG
ncbi:hypothetical protein CE91St56_49280 [Lachnospiraceae bacterium]|jgi:hypothetical protein|nr:hypothetical protein CE91St56_49280 [Lachnospiraceae bacterium]GKH43880.1 hypothetical protein CE91St57_48540 [Lachnospiraceae bacterium]